MQEFLEIVNENFVEICSSIGTILAIFFCRTKNSESLQAAKEKKLERTRQKNARKAAKLQESLRKEAELEKEVKTNVTSL